MGQKKSVDEKLNPEVLEKYLDMLRNIQGHYMTLTISTTKDTDDTWKADGKMQVGSTLDGKHWGEVSMSVIGYDVNSDSALATVMVALNNYVNSPEFVVEMGERMVKSADEEEKIPAALTP